MIRDPFQIARISFLKPQPAEAQRRRPFIPGLNQVSRNIDSCDVSPQMGERNCRGAIAAAKVQDAQRRRYPGRCNHGFS